MRTTLPGGTTVELVEGRGPDAMGLVVVPDIMGLRPLFDEMVARLAAEHGWAVAAYEPWPDREGWTLDQRLGSMAELDHDRLVADAVATADLLGRARTGIIGFCMGGMVAIEAAATGRFDAAAPFYGMIRFPEGWQQPGRPEPVDVLAASAHRCPLLAVIGTDDPYTPAADVADLEALAGVDVVRFEGADHGFVHDPDRPAHRPADAAEAWRRAVAHLAG